MNGHLSPAETAKRFGVSIKALRLYEQHGLLQPVRTSNGSTGAGWRVYGSDQLARLHQIIALKRLGLSLGQIGELLVSGDALAPILAVQEQALVKDGDRIARALAVLRTAQAKLASGAALSIDDLATLTQETVVTTKPSLMDMKDALQPIVQKHLPPDVSVPAWTADHQDLVKTGKALLEEAMVLIASVDATSAEAMDFARRFRVVTSQLMSNPSPATAVMPTLTAKTDDAQADREALMKVEVFRFIGAAEANLKAQESRAKGQG
ncbi:MAG TPA: MerR family transcriptional regulator [Caulobacteraceae bacterium]|jgi:DNA-binding transcriptional MerR regulator